MGQGQVVVTRFTIGNSLFFSVSALGKSTILLVKNAILSEQCGIVSQVGGNKMEIVTS